MITTTLKSQQGQDINKLIDIVNKIDRKKISEMFSSTISNVPELNSKVVNQTKVSETEVKKILGWKKSPRSPLKSLPVNIQDQIKSKQQEQALQSVESSERANKWMKTAGAENEKQDMRSILEKRIGEMRKFLDVDQDNVTVTETLDISYF